ncbi:uncharacterized protein ACA1_342160 [Acanthamoeba castellanii str. Neff]|uniref:Uncharacterized protein n=1 Tax=Acanthamoeba castellanii (strain ATCC 30010 / Neff) TaxID=1257118 RepID=L8HD41_ACACF|nr:uncharacterized protein ACA1_342160 [Acanthamoeba castellanii str. Neff]ELR23142.1 hypothetical protein ACA1_342160 [Acanthamoeba castellanii str. Neff]
MGCTKVINLLMLTGANVNVSNHHGNTPMGGSNFMLLTKSQKRACSFQSMAQAKAKVNFSW